jgi:hypothetical protein
MSSRFTWRVLLLFAVTCVGMAYAGAPVQWRMDALVQLPIDRAISNRGTVARVYKSDIYIFGHQSLSQETVRLYVLRSGRTTWDTMTLSTTVPGITDDLDRRGQFADLHVDSARIVLLYWRKALVYSRTTEYEASLSRVIPLGSSYDEIGLARTDCYVWMCAMTGQPSRVRVAQLNLVDGTVLSEVALPDPPGMPYAYFYPRRVVQVVDDGIIVSEVASPKAVRYSFDGWPIDTLDFGLSSWSSQATQAVERLVRDTVLAALPVKVLLDSLRPFVYAAPNVRTLTRIDHRTVVATIQWADTNTRGLYSGFPRSSHSVLRRNVDGRWIVLCDSLPDSSPELMSPIADSIPYPLSYAYFPGGEGVVYRILPFPEAALRAASFGEMRKVADEYAIENEEEAYSLVLYSIGQHD